MSDPTDDDFTARFARLSNWGRWGRDDQRGALNLLTEATVPASMASVTAGRRVSCSRALKVGAASPAGREFLHHMLSSGADAPEQGFGSTADWFGIGFHGHEYTHLDSPAHILWNGAMYNGFPASDCSASRGALSGSVDEAGDGIIGGAFLVDGPRIKDTPWMRSGDAITAAELDSWCATNGIAPRAGDIVAVRFGRDAAEASGDSFLDQGAPGLALDCMDWMKDRDIAVLVSDAISDVDPAPTPGCRLPVHVLAIAAMGMWLVDNADLGALARTCAELDRWSFVLTMNPLVLKRSTGSPLNPVAIF